MPSQHLHYCVDLVKIACHTKITVHIINDGPNGARIDLYLPSTPIPNVTEAFTTYANKFKKLYLFNDVFVTGTLAPPVDDDLLVVSITMVSVMVKVVYDMMVFTFVLIIDSFLEIEEIDTNFAFYF